MATYDVFDPEGHFVRQIEIACEGDGRFDDLFFLGEDRFLLVTKAYEAAMSLRGTPLDLAESDPGAMEVICMQRED